MDILNLLNILNILTSWTWKNTLWDIDLWTACIIICCFWKEVQCTYFISPYYITSLRFFCPNIVTIYTIYWQYCLPYCEKLKILWTYCDSIANILWHYCSPYCHLPHKVNIYVNRIVNMLDNMFTILSQYGDNIVSFSQRGEQ